MSVFAALTKLAVLAVLPVTINGLSLTLQQYTRNNCLGFNQTEHVNPFVQDTCAPLDSPAAWFEFTVFGDLPGNRTDCFLRVYGNVDCVEDGTRVSYGTLDLVMQRYSRPTCLGFLDTIYTSFGSNGWETCYALTEPAMYFRYTFYGDLAPNATACFVRVFGSTDCAEGTESTTSPYGPIVPRAKIDCTNAVDQVTGDLMDAKAVFFTCTYNSTSS
ncbi:hypothetical protein K488DRAFT_88335 [Vararia minispora EC-137]|uniref:Uncharacterized protein n=1 Tax=Vararia minispora EC-137 TaxID=1314806 RepID=A0ACB8QE13_9AGAM|nr:hypothetical protein K488DRAFT_88335 [Vararia minispora EC-137]